MKRTDTHHPGDRYDLDFGACHFKNGYAQLDTDQDAPYFGMWASPYKLQLVTFCEGDLCVQTAGSDTEFAELIRNVAKWHGDGFKGIDCMYDEGITDLFRVLGLSDLTH